MAIIRSLTKQPREITAVDISYANVIGENEMESSDQMRARRAAAYQAWWEHQPVRVELADASLGELRVSGILRADNAANLWRLLEEQHGIRVERRADETVVLSRRR